jgi:hypothetical protein
MHGDWNLAPNSRLYLSMYGSLFVRKFRQKYRRLRTRLYRELRLSLHLDLNLYLFLRSFRQLFATLFGSMRDLKHGELLAWSHVAQCRQRLPGRRPVGRGVGGRIVGE